MRKRSEAANSGTTTSTAEPAPLQTSGGSGGTELGGMRKRSDVGGGATPPPDGSGMTYSTPEQKARNVAGEPMERRRSMMTADATKLGLASAFKQDVGAVMQNAVDEGDSVEISIGKSVLWPIKFNGFEVGPITLSVRVRKGETIADAYSRARLSAAVLFQAEYDIKLLEFEGQLAAARDKIHTQGE